MQIRVQPSCETKTSRTQGTAGGNVKGWGRYKSPIWFVLHSVPSRVKGSHLSVLELAGGALLWYKFFCCFSTEAAAHFLVSALRGALLIFLRRGFAFCLILRSFSYRREAKIRRWVSLMRRGCFVYRGCRWMLSAWTEIESSMLQSPLSLPTVIFANPTTCLMSFPNVASRPHQTALLLSWVSVWLKLPCLSGNRTLIYSSTPKLMFCSFHPCWVHSFSIALQEQCVNFSMDLRSLV